MRLKTAFMEAVTAPMWPEVQTRLAAAAVAAAGAL